MNNNEDKIIAALNRLDDGQDTDTLGGVLADMVRRQSFFLRAFPVIGMLASPCAWKGSSSEVGARNTLCGERITARSMKFCNSRTFPGHGYRTSASIVYEEISLIPLFIRRA